MLRILRILAQTPASRTTAIAFALNSTLFGNWFARIPAVQAELGLSDGALGLALLGLPVGSIITLPTAGWLVACYGAGRVTWWATFALCLVIPGPALAGSGWELFLALALLGIANGAQDIAMNAEAAAIEARSSLSMMSAFHGMFSLGGVVGAGVGGILAGAGVGPLPHLLTLAVLTALLTLSRRGTLGVQAPVEAGAAPFFAVPRGALVGLALLCFATMLGEGAAADWSAVYLLNDLGAGPFLAGLGYAFFAAGMTLGRFSGDALRDRFGEVPLVRGGALLAALALGLGLLLGHPLPAILGLACLGIGYAGIVPIIFRRAAMAPGFAPGTALAAVGSVGYMGFLAGPPAIGLVAEVTGLGLALGIVPLLSLVIAFTAGPAIRAAEGAEAGSAESGERDHDRPGPIIEPSVAAGEPDQAPPRV